MNEVIACPSCQRKVSIPTEYFGKQVQCPECKQTFVAQDPNTENYRPQPPARRPETFAAPPEEDRWEERDPGVGRTSRRRRPSSDYDDDDLSFGRAALPHRGGAILTLGILALVLCGPILGPIAWIMGQTDLKQIRAGQMDRSGEGSTQAGMICGMIATILSAIVLTIWCFVFMAAAAGGGF